jgi:hypothetical protein
MKTRFVYSLAAACPVEVIPAADALCEALGWGKGNFTAPLTTGKGITHMGILTRIQPDVADLLRNPPRDMAPVVAALALSIREAPAHDDPQHWREFLGKHGLRPVEVAE